MPTAQVLTLTLLTLIGLTYATPTLLETLPYSSVRLTSTPHFRIRSVTITTNPYSLQNDFPETIAPIVSVSSDGASAYALLLIELPDSGVTVSMQKCSLGQGAPACTEVIRTNITSSGFGQQGYMLPPTSSSGPRAAFEHSNDLYTLFCADPDCAAYNLTEHSNVNAFFGEGSSIRLVPDGGNGYAAGLIATDDAVISFRCTDASCSSSSSTSLALPSGPSSFSLKSISATLIPGPSPSNASDSKMVAAYYKSTCTDTTSPSEVVVSYCADGTCTAPESNEIVVDTLGPCASSWLSGFVISGVGAPNTAGLPWVFAFNQGTGTNAFYLCADASCTSATTRAGFAHSDVTAWIPPPSASLSPLFFYTRSDLNLFAPQSLRIVKCTDASCASFDSLSLGPQSGNYGEVAGAISGDQSVVVGTYVLNDDGAKVSRCWIDFSAASSFTPGTGEFPSPATGLGASFVSVCIGIAVAAFAMLL